MLELLITEGPQAGRRVPLGPTPVSLGRSSQATISFPGDSYMSGVHLEASQAADGVVLTDMRSTNGTFVNGERVQKTVAAVGDTIRLGALTLRVVSAEAGDRSKAGTGMPPTPITQVIQIPNPLSLQGPAVTARPPAPQNTQDAVLHVLRSAGEPLFCLVDAAVDPMIYSLLSVGAEKHQTQSLYDGESAINLAPWAPYLLSLTPDSPLLRVLLEKGWGKAWASYFVSSAPFEQLRSHFRRFLMVQIEQGQQVYFRFYDPRVLRDFLPTATSEELTVFLGPVTEWLLESADKAALLRLRNSPEGLAKSVVPLGGNGATQMVTGPG